METVQEQIIQLAKENHLTFEVSVFPSGAVIIDIWVKESLFVVQLTGGNIGLSVLDEEPAALDTRPDRLFENFSQFKEAFLSMIRNNP